MLKHMPLISDIKAAVPQPCYRRMIYVTTELGIIGKGAG